MAKKDKIENDESIVSRVKDGDIEAYGELMQRYEKKLLRYVVYLTREQISSSDVVQETFIKAFVNLRGFNSKYKFSSWIFRIAHNEAMNAIKKEGRLVHGVDLDHLEYNHDENHLSTKLDKAAMNEELFLCMDQLRKEYREVLILQYFENMKYIDISDVLQIPVSTVGVRSARAKKKLKEICLKKGVTYE
jgi:RNA polymerase sigma-70 factor (ECF subfamily)